jgi:F-type H+-transporting ATPase subunit b
LFNIGRNFAAETAEAASEGGIGALGVDLKGLILQIATFVLVFILLKKFALDKILKTLEERRKTIEEGVKLGQQMAQEKEKLAEQIEKMLKGARSEADKIIAAGHKDAGQIVQAAEAAAAKKTESLLAEAKVQINEEVKQARRSLEKEILTLVADTSEAVLGEKLDSSGDAQLIKRELQKVAR